MIEKVVTIVVIVTMEVMVARVNLLSAVKYICVKFLLKCLSKQVRFYFYLVSRISFIYSRKNSATLRILSCVRVIVFCVFSGDDIVKG